MTYVGRKNEILIKKMNIQIKKKLRGNLVIDLTNNLTNEGTLRRQRVPKLICYINDNSGK